VLAASGLKGFNRSARVGSDGRFRLDGLAGGPVELVFTRADPWQGPVVTR
jgi:hypothetical protein